MDELDYHDASLVQIRGKTEPPRRPLSFPSNFKLSCALNRRQSDLQEASVHQPYLPAMEVSRGINLVGPDFLFLGVTIGNYWRWTFFCFPIPIWGVGKQQILGRKYSELLEMLLLSGLLGTTVQENRTAVADGGRL